MQLLQAGGYDLLIPSELFPKRDCGSKRVKRGLIA